MPERSTLEALLDRDRYLVAAILVAIIIACWVYLLLGAGTGMYPHEMASVLPDEMSMDASAADAASVHDQRRPGMSSSEGSTMSRGMLMMRAAWTPGYALVMFVMWWLMMVAMMLPSAAPMVLLHAAVTRRSTAAEPDGRSRVPAATAAFAGGYLAMWAVFSIAAVAAQWGLERIGLLSPMQMTATDRFLGAGLLLAAGIWQLTPLKTVCLRHCRSPIGYLSSRWRSGPRGALAMGVEHGLYCLGCCWFLMALLFYGGVMNLVWIVGLALLVLIEKLAPAGLRIARVTGMVLIAGGGWLASRGFT